MTNPLIEKIRETKKYLEELLKNRLAEDCTEGVLKNDHLRDSIDLLASLEKAGKGEDENIIGATLLEQADEIKRLYGKVIESKKQTVLSALGALSRLSLRAALSDEERKKIKRETLELMRNMVLTAASLADILNRIDRQLASLEKKEEANDEKP